MLRQAADGQNILAVHHIRISVEQPVVVKRPARDGVSNREVPTFLCDELATLFCGHVVSQKRAPYGALAKVCFAVPRFGLSLFRARRADQHTEDQDGSRPRPEAI